MKKAEMKIIGKIVVEIAKLAVFWQAVVPWASDILEYNWDWNEQLVSIVMVAAVSFAGYFCICNVKGLIEESKIMRETRKNLKKERGAKKASSSLFAVRGKMRWLDILRRVGSMGYNGIKLTII